MPLSACGKSDSIADDGVLSATRFRQRYALATCEVGYECGDFSENVARRCRFSFDSVPAEPELEAAIRRRTTALDSAMAELCLEALRSTCGRVEIGACQHVFVGTVPEGGVCNVSEECANGGVCTGSDGANAELHCVARVEAGGECFLSSDCATAPGEVAVCESFDGKSRCFFASTVEAVGLGEACGASMSSSNQVEFRYCDPYLRCAEGACSPLIEAGEPCASPEDCGPDAICVFGNSECVPTLIREEIGDSCGLNLDVEPHLNEECNAETLACVQGVCERKGDGSEGSLCDDRQLFNACDDGFACDDNSGMCVQNVEP